MTFERVARKRYIPSEPSSSEIIKFIGSRYCFLMSFEKVSRKRNMPFKPLSSEIIQIIWSMCGFLMNLEKGIRSRDIPFQRGARRAQELQEGPGGFKVSK